MLSSCVENYIHGTDEHYPWSITFIRIISVISPKEEEETCSCKVENLREVNGGWAPAAAEALILDSDIK